jgi:ribonuclease E
MLFNATQAEELRVAIVDGQKLVDLDIEHAGQEQRKSNIYKAKVTRVEPSLEAIFVDYGAERHGFLPFKELTREYVQGEDGEGTRGKIAQNLRVGQELLVQVEKDERGNKGAALTTYISLAGRYLVLMPNNPRGGGVSRRVEGEDRAELRETLDALNVPEGMSVIARTAGIGRSAEELQWDLNYLLQLWEAIEGAGKDVKAPELIYLESSLVVRAIRDLFQPDIGEILIDTQEIFEQAQSFMSTVMPGNVNKVKLYKDDVPLFSRFQIEHQIETAYRRDVGLPSGGAIVIDHTEALVSVDVNSARATKGHDIEETAFRTNCEAADEIARQLRLRDLGGLVVIDFIDMESTKNQREVENRLRDALRHDRARVQTGKISRFGLLELSRQRLQPALSESSYIPCPRCSGVGHIRDTASSALHVLRILQEEAMKENTAAVHAQVPVDVATFLLNEKRQDIHKIEMRFKVNVLLIPNTHLETPNYELERLRHDSEKLDAPTLSYQMVNKPVEDVAKMPATAQEAKPSRPEPVVKGITPDQPAPIAAEPTPRSADRKPAGSAAPTASLWQRFMGMFRSDEPSAPAPAATAKPARESRDANRGDRTRRDGKRGGSDRGERGERGNRPGQSGQGQRPPREGRPDQGPRADKAEGKAQEQRGPETRDTQKPRQPQPAKPALEAKPLEQGDEGEGRGRRRRGRGGRGRGRDGAEVRGNETRNDAPVSESEAAQVNGAMVASAHAADNGAISAATVAVASVAAVVVTRDEVPSAASSAPVMPAPTPSAVTVAEVPAPAVIATPAAPPAEVAPVATPVVKAAPVVIAAIDQIPDVAPVRSQPRPRNRPTSVAQASEPLVFIETQAEKIASVQMVEEEAPRRRTPRPRKAREVVNEPLIVVETKADGSGQTPNA